jgi:hypothetical protein
MIDRYTKAVLTVIAICLAVIAIRGAQPISPALAQSPVHVIVDQVAGFALQFAGPLHVRCDDGCR